ncbi:MAG: DUF4491 family protein [Bacteroidales bacterium]|nr:DUF4491 family protein [Bacteroidales bacterium]
MDWSGILLGASAFLIIGLFHPIVIKAEYHWGKRCWWLFAVVGLGFCIASLLCKGILSAVMGVVGFSCFWSILELFQQEKRVAKGIFCHERESVRSLGQKVGTQIGCISES